MDRNETIAHIRKHLKARTGKDWSVRGGTGTAWGWIDIDAPPRRRTFNYDGTAPVEGQGYASKEDRQELAKALGLDSVHSGGVSIPSGNDYYQEYMDRAEGKEPTRVGVPYWD